MIEHRKVNVELEFSLSDIDMSITIGDELDSYDHIVRLKWDTYVDLNQLDGNSKELIMKKIEHKFRWSICVEELMDSLVSEPKNQG